VFPKSEQYTSMHQSIHRRIVRPQVQRYSNNLNLGRFVGLPPQWDLRERRSQAGPGAGLFHGVHARSFGPSRAGADMSSAGVMVQCPTSEASADISAPRLRRPLTALAIVGRAKRLTTCRASELRYGHLCGRPQRRAQGPWRQPHSLRRDRRRQ
jgi:hypothetical protein